MESVPSGIIRSKITKFIKAIFLVIIDALIVNISAFCSIALRMIDAELALYEPIYLNNYFKYAIFFTVGAIIIFHIFRLYRSLWEFAGIDDAIRIITAGVSVNAIYLVCIYFDNQYLPRSFPVINSLILITLLCAVRFGIKFFRNAVKRRKGRVGLRVVRTLVIGGGEAGATIIRELRNSSRIVSDVICIADDDPFKRGSSLYGVRILGNRFDIPKMVEKYGIEEIIFAIPTASAKDKHEILEICQRTGCSLRTLPGLYQLVNGEVSIEKIRNVEVEDLLGRDSVKVDIQEISSYVRGKTVLVTGGGGSIGSELCRQLAANSPKRLIIFDIYENNAYGIEQELKHKFPALDIAVLIGSVRDEERVNEIFDRFKPDIVYHAAAHKHVPLMENSPNEAVKNNVFGTYNVAAAADRYRAETFILISTDKAVNPTNIMGASKRICEMVVQYFADKSDTKFAAVRFGNVLGSNGSVVPLFKSQIEMGGPVTVTHPDIIRYFMTIPEAVSLVLQAGAYANNGEIFVLDMGNPVKIDDLARNMIRLSGFEPDVDIMIEYTGLREGEKLYEELLLSGEGLGKTPNNLIFIGHPQKKDDDVFISEMEELRNAFTADHATLSDLIRKIVPEYHPELGGQKK